MSLLSDHRLFMRKKEKEWLAWLEHEDRTLDDMIALHRQFADRLQKRKERVTEILHRNGK